MNPTNILADLTRAGWRRLGALCVIIALALSTPVRADGGAKTLQRLADPVILEGSELSMLSGKEIDNIRVYAFHGHRPVAIPYQIDQRDSTGCWVWSVVYRQSYRIDYDSGSAPIIREPETAGTGTYDDQDPKGKALLDANDVAVFMADDLGDRGSNVHAALHSDLVEDIEITDPTRIRPRLVPRRVTCSTAPKNAWCALPCMIFTSRTSTWPSFTTCA
jgi:hypothetical protein